MSIEKAKTDLHDVQEVLSPAPRVSLLIYHREGVQVVPLFAERPLTIGRSQTADIVVHDQSLSRWHARIEMHEEGVWVEDLHSTNGTWLNGKRIRREQLTPDDELTFGPLVVSLHVVAPTKSALQGLDTNDQFTTLLGEEVKRARAFKRKLALLMVRPAKNEKGRFKIWGLRIRQQLREIDRMGIYAQDVAQILLPEVQLAEATRLAQDIVKPHPQEPPLVCSVAIFPDSSGSPEELVEHCRRALQRASVDEPIQTYAGGINAHHPSEEAAKIVVHSPAMLAVYSTVERVASSSMPVLILGETGTGKEVVANKIHQSSHRKDRPLLCVNCGAIPEQLIESTLFGHVRGAFTGADAPAKGVFEEADGGTVLLDEIGELSQHAQVTLLRVLENQQITRVGANRAVNVDVRVIAATHRDLEQMCREETFRWDLFYRLNILVIKIPPLRERTEEISPLVSHFIQQAVAANGCAAKGLSAEVQAQFQRYHWPGNVRELRNVVERAVVVAQGDAITISDLPEHLGRCHIFPSREPAEEQWRDVTMEFAMVPSMLDDERHTTQVSHPGERRLDPAEIQPPRRQDLKTRLQKYETELICKALQQSGGNQSQAAKLLATPRRTLLYKMDRYQIDKRGGDRDLPHITLGQDKSLKAMVQQHEQEILRQTLHETKGDHAEAARLLGTPKSSLVGRLRKYGVK